MASKCSNRPKKRKSNRGLNDAATAGAIGVSVALIALGIGVPIAAGYYVGKGSKK